jgi:hypothetical protein
MRKLTLTLVLLLAITVPTAIAQADSSKSNYASAQRAVCYYFGPNCGMAMKIVNCETGGSYSPWASNGQYLGMFQMGSYARSRYGHGNSVWAQAKAAYAYFKDAGFSPWLNYEPPGCAM